METGFLHSTEEGRSQIRGASIRVRSNVRH